MRVFTHRNRVAVSRTVTVVVIVVVIVAAAVGAYVFTTTTPTPSSSMSSSASSMMSTFGPTNSSVLIDDSQTRTPDTLDPATGTRSIDQWVFNQVWQPLVTFVGPNSTQGVVAPCLAENYSVQNNQYYTFDIRPDVTFSNGDPMNAAVAWWNFVRDGYINQGFGNFNYEYLTQPATGPESLATSGLSLYWGVLEAIQNVTGLPATTNYNVAQSVLNNLLSNFDPNNATIQKIMSYPNQAFVVSGPMTFVIKLLMPYSSAFYLSNIAQWWLLIIDPAYVDAHGGVQANTPNAYFNLNGGPGTGPYYIASVAAGFSTVVLKANPTYWGLHATNIPPVLQPAHIPVVIVNFGVSANERQLAFDTNQAQISWVESPLFGHMWSGYNYKQYTTFSGVLDNFGAGPNAFFVTMNVGKSPTSNNDFRLAVVHAINYTQLLDETYGFNGTVYAENYLGPLTPEYGQYYNPGHLPLYSYDTGLAASYLNEAGQAENFSVTLPNGTVIGNPSAPPLAPLTMAVYAPMTETEQTQFAIIQSDLGQIGIPIAVEPVTSSEMGTFVTPQLTPPMASLFWGPDWVDPVFQQMYPLMTWLPAECVYMNVTQINNLVTSIMFDQNQTTYMQGIAQLYSLDYNYAPMIWLPNADAYVLKQPYVQGMVYSSLSTVGGMYWFNTLYYGSS